MFSPLRWIVAHALRRARSQSPRAAARPTACLFGVAAGAFTAAASAAEDPFAAGVRPTGPLTPPEQRAAFRVPGGFEVQLVAHEPDIHKPMNLNFDATGRLWVSTSREYPFAVPVGTPGRDRIMIFEDFGPDGRARRVTTFADGLNIPIGVYPFRTGNQGWKAIVWSIPNIWLFSDDNNDGKADTRTILYGPFDHTRDTHGNQASFRRGFDGWIYATHGYNNDSHVAGADGHKVHLNSGNTYRFRIDGSRIEQFTYGQVNPYGLAFDPRGDLFSSDCHSDPIYLLLPGGNYPSFGKPHDGLGFAPNMMEKLRGSTAIDGISYYADNLWPAEYDNSIFIGDVMTSRVYRDLAVNRGSGRTARAQPDFVVSEDPWFRPVDTTFGPDGALYIADFYNKIIGHYEVPLRHPERDRERGRIWRVVPKGVALRPPALAQSLEGLITELASPSLPRRSLASQEITDRFGATAETPLKVALAQPSNAFQRVHVLWLLQRLGKLSPAKAVEAGSATDPLVRLHARRIASEWFASASRKESLPEEWLHAADLIARTGLDDADPAVQRAAVEAIAERPVPEHFERLVAFLSTIPENDVHLRYSARRALRNLLLRNPDFFATLAEKRELPEPTLQAVLDVSLGVKSEPSARFLLRFRERFVSKPEFSTSALNLIARHAAPPDLERLVESIQRESTADLDLQLNLFRSIRQGFTQRGTPLTPTFQTWAARLASSLLASTSASSAWSARPLENAAPSATPWDFEERRLADNTRAKLISSLPRGERLTGILASAPFPAPARIAFDLAGHDGPPDRPPQKRNAARLLDAESRAVLEEVPAPRNDTAQRIVWDLARLQGRSVILEVTDADPGDAYAWIAFGRLEPATVPLPTVAPAAVAFRQIAAAELANAAGTDGAIADKLSEALRQLADNQAADPSARAAALRATSRNPVARAAADVVADESLPYAWRSRTANSLFPEQPSEVETLIASVWKEAPRRFQIRFAGIAGVSPDLTHQLLVRFGDGSAPATLLQDGALRDRLRQGARPEDRSILDRLSASLPSEDVAIQKLLDDRRATVARSRPDPARGQQVFTAACAACHQIAGQGGLVGPQLNGIGTRGEERLTEDILAPNRNVDQAFWTTTLTLKDGESVSGLFRREEGETFVLANATGAEFLVPKSDVTKREVTGTSIMPSNFAEAIPIEDFVHLLGFLSQLRGKP